MEVICSTTAVGCKNYIRQIGMPIYRKQNKYNHADFEQYDKRIPAF
jgi:hypothetical protein